MKKLIVLLLFAGIGMTACKKPGCTDPKANNHSAEAKKDDGSCTYTGTAIFWMNATTAYDISSTTWSSEVRIYINGTLKGTLSTNNYSSSTPTCGSTKGYNYSEDMGTSSTSAKTYEIRTYDPFSEEETTYSTGSFTLNGGDCATVEIQ